MSIKSLEMSTSEVDEGYEKFEQGVAAALGRATKEKILLTTTATPEALWGAYLEGIVTHRRQHYNCNACRKFIQTYGGLVSVDPLGNVDPVIWGSEEVAVKVPMFFCGATARLYAVVYRSKVNGVFFSSDEYLGTPTTNRWEHLSAKNGSRWSNPIKTASQMAAEKLEEFKLLITAIAEYKHQHVEQALRILRTDSVSRAEKSLAMAEWFEAVLMSVKSIRGKEKTNLLWLAVAGAPNGFCHVKNTVLGEMMNDVKAGYSFEVVKRRWEEKVHPLQYQRPTAAPSVSSVNNAEKIVEKLNLSPSLKRRYATLDDVLVKLWTPPTYAVEIGETKVEKTKVFSHLLEKYAPKIELPSKTVTMNKFLEDVMPKAQKLKVFVTSLGAYYGLVTAEVADANPILQWDGLEGHARNPVSWYFYLPHSPAERWGLKAGTWADVSSVFLSPQMWQEPSKFTHHAPQVHFSIAGAVDQGQCGIGLFPEILRSDLYGLRKVIEAFSNSKEISERELGNANGIAMAKGRGVRSLSFRVETLHGDENYVVDRWE